VVPTETNVAIEYRWAEGDYDRLPGLAAELVGRKVDVIVAGGPPPAWAKGATSMVPIVFLSGDDPVATGLVASLARPGGNITGISFLNVELHLKRLELLSELVPRARVIALLVNPTNSNARARDPGSAGRGAGEGGATT
jgi:putative tryptophan/tyrosine transport system substrate-binding protein